MIRCDMISQISYSISESENIKKLKTTMILTADVRYYVYVYSTTYTTTASYCRHNQGELSPV